MPGWRSVVGPLAALAGCLLLVAPAHAADDRIAAALAAREAGDNERAIVLLRAAVAAAPTDADALRQLGTTLAYAHRYAEAIAVLKRARALAPGDADIRLALARAMLWSGDRQGARGVAAEVAALQPANAELADLSAAITAAERDAPRPALDVVETVSDVRVAGLHRTWSETVATLAVPVGARTVLAGGIDAEDRVTATDVRLSLRGDRRFAGGDVYLGATATPDATFRERWSVLTGATKAVKPYLLASIEVRRAHYDGVDVTVVEPGLTVHAPTDRWAISAHSVNLWGEGGRYHDGWSLRGDYAAPHAIRLFAGGATYSDTEGGATRRVDSAFAGVGFPVSHRLGVQLVADHEVRHTSYRRDGLTLGLHWRLGR